MRAEAVKTSRVIRPLGIAEIGRAGGQGIRGHRKPDGIARVGAGFDHDDQIGGSRSRLSLASPLLPANDATMFDRHFTRELSNYIRCFKLPAVRRTLLLQAAKGLHFRSDVFEIPSAPDFVRDCSVAQLHPGTRLIVTG